MVWERHMVHLSDSLSFYNPSWALRSSTAGFLNTHNYAHKKIRSASFYNYAPKLWNTLPKAIRQALWTFLNDTWKHILSGFVSNFYKLSNFIHYLFSCCCFIVLYFLFFSVEHLELYPLYERCSIIIIIIIIC